jgi:hypothetical protein
VVTPERGDPEVTRTDRRVTRVCCQVNAAGGEMATVGEDKTLR